MLSFADKVMKMGDFENSNSETCNPIGFSKPMSFSKFVCAANCLLCNHARFNCDEQGIPFSLFCVKYRDTISIEDAQKILKGVEGK